MICVLTIIISCIIEMKKCDAMIKNQLFKLKIMGSILFIIIVSSHVVSSKKEERWFFC